jgi:hypothetical protein
MAGTNTILEFCATDTGTNLITDSAYNTDAQRPIGNQSGTARSALVNKALRQSTLMAAGLAQFIADNQANNILDTLTPATIETYLIAALQALGSPAVQNKSTTYLLQVTDRNSLINAITGTWTLSLMAGSGVTSGFGFKARNSGGGIITIAPNGADNLDGASTLVLQPGDEAHILWDGTTWWTTARFQIGGGAWSTGDIKMSFKTVADAGWILANDTSIGDASSGATGRANADTLLLYTLLWTNVADQWSPVVGGRGASAAADFAAHKPMNLPKTLGRALAGYGLGSTAETATASSANGFTVLSNNTKWITGMPVILSSLSGFTSSATAGPTYYAVRISSTNVRLATTLALAQNLTPDVTISGSGSVVLTYTFTSRAIGEQAGEEAHAQSINELLAHTHAQTGNGAAGSTGPLIGGSNNAQGAGPTSPTGGNQAANIISPRTYVGIMIKL